MKYWQVLSSSYSLSSSTLSSSSPSSSSYNDNKDDKKHDDDDDEEEEEEEEDGDYSDDDVVNQDQPLCAVHISCQMPNFTQLLNAQNSPEKQDHHNLWQCKSIWINIIAGNLA